MTDTTPPPEFSRASRDLCRFVGRLLHEANDAAPELKALALLIVADRAATPDQIGFIADHIGHYADDLAHAGDLQEALGTNRVSILLDQRALELANLSSAPPADPRLDAADH